MAIRGCWSCGSHGPCEDECLCAKCIDPDSYQDWRNNCPEEYDAWLERQTLGWHDECDCPSCFERSGW